MIDMAALQLAGASLKSTADIATGLLKLKVIPPSGMPDSRWGFPSGPISDSMW